MIILSYFLKDYGIPADMQSLNKAAIIFLWVTIGLLIIDYLLKRNKR